jgi:hypothetical protein
VEDFLKSPQAVGEITGPTNCGKSTFALLPLFDAGLSVLLVQPSAVNVANALVEARFRVPDAVARLKLSHTIPEVAHCTFLNFIDSPAQLNLCDSSAFVSFVHKFGCFPPVDVIVLDEYHLPDHNHLLAYFYLMHLSPVLNPPRVLFVSATPLDAPPPPVRTDGLTVTTLPVPDIMAPPSGTIYSRQVLGRYGNNVLLVVADCCASAHRLARTLNDLGEAAGCLCACGTVEASAALLRERNRDFTFVATPLTEAGITVNCSHMVNPGKSVRMVFDRGVLHVADLLLGPRQSVQRLGRAGRLRHTLVYTETARGEEALDSPSPVSLGAAYVGVFALTGTRPDSPRLTPALREFPRVSEAGYYAALAGLVAPTPVLELYKRDADGELFSEFGGSASGFVEQCGPHLRLFTWPGGRAFAPFVDLTQPHDPTEGQTLASLKSLSDTLYQARFGSAEVDLEAALAHARTEPEAFAQAIWLGLSQLDGESNLWSNDVTRVRDRGRPSYMFGSVGGRAWEVLASLGGTVEMVGTEITHPGEPDNYRIDRLVHFRGQTFSYRSSKIMDDDRMVDEKKVTALLVPHLRPVAATYAIQSDRTVTTDLSSFAKFRPRSANPWFRSLPL